MTIRARCLVLCLVVAPQVLRADDDESPRRRFIAADSSKQRIAIINEAGETEWEYAIGPLHDFQVLPGGAVLLQTSWTRLVEVDPANGEILWSYDAATSNGNAGRPVEVHAFQRLADGNTMVVESGPARIIEVDSDGSMQCEVPLKVDNPHPHHDTRLARKLEDGNYLVCHEADGAVREYNGDGNVVWEFKVPLFGRELQPGHGVDSFGNQCFAALRLPDGNTLIATGNGHSVIEVTPEREIVWSLHQNDLPGIQLAWVTTLQVLPGGNLVLGNCHAGPENPQIIEITREKAVVWTFRDFERFGNALTNSRVLGADEPLVQGTMDNIDNLRFVVGAATP